MSSHRLERTPFASRLLRHAMRDRARRETGSPDSSTSPMFDDWQEGVHDWVPGQTVELAGNGDIRLHDYVAAGNSSMVFGFNLCMPFREHDASSLEALLAGALGMPDRVVNIEFEFQGPTDVLAECAGARPTDDERFTASDVAIHVEDGAGRTGLVLIEVKLSEGGFTPCGGAQSRANGHRDVCAFRPRSPDSQERAARLRVTTSRSECIRFADFDNPRTVARGGGRAYIFTACAPTRTSGEPAKSRRWVRG